MAAQYSCNQPMLQPTTTTNSGLLLSPILPDELIADILLRLPVRSLLRFKSVCKSWETLISDPQFANTHLRFSTAEDTSITNQQLIFFTKIESYRILTYHLKQLFENPSTCAKPVISSFLNMKKYGIFGSCNGLLCLFDRSQKRLKLFNPSIRVKSKKSPQVFPLIDWTRRYYGFGYDQINDKYKFLVVLKDYDNGETLTKIYTFGEDSNKTIQNFPCKSNTSSGEYVSGTLNWIVNEEDAVVKHRSILSFDLNKETHREMLLPQRDGGKVHTNCKLCVLSNCLCTIVFEKSHWVVWLMKQVKVAESWTKLMIIPYEKFRSNSIPFHPYVDPLFISENGVVLLRDKVASKFVLYNLNSGELVYPFLSWGEHPFYLPIQRESLVSPQRNKTLKQCYVATMDSMNAGLQNPMS